MMRYPTLRYWGLFFRFGLRPLIENPRRTVINASVMFIQNLALFASWIVLFHAVGPIRGWALPQLWLLYGLMYTGMGFGLFFTEGSRQLADKVANGDLDIYLTRPGRLLPQLFIEKFSPANLGDMLCGLVFILGPARLSGGQMLLALGAALLIGLLVIVLFLLYQSLAFFVKGGPLLSAYLFDGVWYASQTPQEGQSWIVKLLLFTIIPAGFINIFSVRLIERAELLWLGGFAVVVAVYAGLAVWVFNAGVKRYVRAKS
jgi:ABC-2 type transport system permease protein